MHRDFKMASLCVRVTTCTSVNTKNMRIQLYLKASEIVAGSFNVSSQNMMVVCKTDIRVSYIVSNISSINLFSHNQYYEDNEGEDRCIIIMNKRVKKPSSAN